MKVYFTGAMRGGRENQQIYKIIVDHLKSKGFEVMTEHVARDYDLEKDDRSTEKERYDKDIEYLESADFMIAEISLASTGVGYEIGYLEGRKKPILCLCKKEREKFASLMVTGNTKGFITVKYYSNEAEMFKIIDEFVKTLK